MYSTKNIVRVVLNLRKINSLVPIIIHLSGEKLCKSVLPKDIVQCLLSGLEPRQHDLETSAVAMRSPRA